ncbi:MAG: dihydroorotate dehydrogenase electron transfer subunit [Anaerolineae bacterium]|nr:dihydroorotate dehydrogenase electron transfer subunit [Anaerolineae bacterium]
MHEVFTVVHVRAENYRTKTLILDRSLSAQPGQFVMAWLPGVDEKPLSIAAEAPLALTVVSVGPFSEALHGLGLGASVWVRGPLGHGFTLPDDPLGKRILLVGGGYGVAPLLFLARRARAVGCTVDVCIGARTSADVLLAASFSAVGAMLRITTEDGSAGSQGMVTQAVDEALRAERPYAVYACGPIGMLGAVEHQCKRYGLPHQLSWEAHMRCGMGLCGACEVHGRSAEGWLACHDGPVDRG